MELAKVHVSVRRQVLVGVVGYGTPKAWIKRHPEIENTFCPGTGQYGSYPAIHFKKQVYWAV